MCSYCFFMCYITFTSTLKIADQNGIAFPGDKTRTLDNVVFALNKNGHL